jgi:hypothetical protein
LADVFYLWGHLRLESSCIQVNTVYSKWTYSSLVVKWTENLGAVYCSSHACVWSQSCPLHIWGWLCIWPFCLDKLVFRQVVWRNDAIVAVWICQTSCYAFGHFTGKSFQCIPKTIREAPTCVLHSLLYILIKFRINELFLISRVWDWGIIFKGIFRQFLPITGGWNKRVHDMLANMSY